MEISEDDYLAHYGTPRHSGRYPWGSGQKHEKGLGRTPGFADYVAEMRREGMSDTDIARGLGISTTDLRASLSIAKNEKRTADIAMAQRLKDKGYSNTAIGERMGINESSVRSLLAPGRKDKLDVLQATTTMLKDRVGEDGIIDIGSGVEHHIGISDTKLRTAVAALKDEGYQVQYIKVPQMTGGNETTMKVLVPPGQTYADTYARRDQIKQIRDISTEDGGRSYFGIVPPIAVSQNRVGVRYAEEGGTDADGVIYVRPGKEDLSLGKNRYAQVRIQVGDNHYLKGMAIYKDDLPPGVDLLFNTNKSNTGNKLDAMKTLKDDPDNPFGSVVRQITKVDANGNRKATSAMNIVNEEGDWDEWGKSISAQVLSKQPTSLAKSQLDLTYERSRSEFDEIMSLTNPVVKRQLLQEFSDSVDAKAVDLKAAALPRQQTRVILPVNSLKTTEVYAPHFRDGEPVVLIRFPHGGKFEIPELTVNNRNAEGKKLLGTSRDAVGINSKVAERLSGADFDGDSVVVIPNPGGRIKSSPALAGLKGFDPQRSYKNPEGVEFSGNKQRLMGDVTNLIADMTIKGASDIELAAAVRHSMVVIDAEKHNLNYKQSALDNGIANLKKKYQGRSDAGASTLITRATSEKRVDERIARRARDGGPIDPKTGKKVYTETGATYETTRNGKTKVVKKTTASTKLAETDDAHTLSSGTPIEKVYADHSNRLKSLANEARRELVTVKNPRVSTSAKAVYTPQVETLNAKLREVQRNRPLERQALVFANSVVDAKRKANPKMTAEELRKVKSQALTEARTRVGLKKASVDITPKEWEAIQAGAVSANVLTQILQKADAEQVRSYATPRKEVLMTSTATRRAQTMLNSGYTQAEIADALGVSLTTLKNAVY